MEIFSLALMVATFFCSLVAGFLFAFAIVVMPGIRSLGDRDFLRAFQVMDRVIQRNQPLFLLVWVGSVVALATAVLLGIGDVGGVEQLLVIVAGLAYLGGVQWPTVAINIPLNNRLQALDVDTLDEATSATTRQAFEPRWNRWNAFRAAWASLVSALLIVLLLGR